VRAVWRKNAQTYTRPLDRQRPVSSCHGGLTVPSSLLARADEVIE
jgi:hypothetical protein